MRQINAEKLLDQLWKEMELIHSQIDKEEASHNVLALTSQYLTLAKVYNCILASTQKEEE